MTVKKMFGDIYTGMLLVMIAGTFMNSQYFFILSIGYYAVQLTKSGLELAVPCVSGFKLYITVILYGTIVGLLMYGTRSVVRDLYYVLPTILWILIGTNAAFLEDEKDLFKTLFLYGSFVATRAAVTFVTRFTLDFNVMRSIFGSNVYDVGFILPVAIVQIFMHDRVYVSKGIDRMIVVLMAMQVLLSLGRMAILQPILMMTVLIVMECKMASNKSELKKIAIVLSFLVIFFIGTFYLMPSSVKNTLLEKVLNSVSEVDASQNISTVGEAMNNWRAYEIQAAQVQWKSSGVLTQIFGSGFGKGIEIRYIPFSWAGIVENNEIPLLHNGFYTMLTKGGVFGVFALLWLFVGNCFKGYSMMKYTDERQHGMVVMAISVASIANTYVVRGPIQQGAFLIWAVLLGWISKKEV